VGTSFFECTKERSKESAPSHKAGVFSGIVVDDFPQAIKCFAIPKGEKYLVYVLTLFCNPLRYTSLFSDQEGHPTHKYQ
jgi:hypothetical protein